MSSVITTSQTRRIAILQSNYIPWKGYFDIIKSVDDFVIYDDMQYTKNDWRNRNRIQTSQGLKWLTIPVRQERLDQTIRETRTAGGHWAKKHWKALSQNYSKAARFKGYRDRFEELYMTGLSEYLSEINRTFILAVNDILGIPTRIHRSSDYRLVPGKTERLIELCKQFHATEYLSGPSAKCYLDESLFRQENIDVRWADYGNYPQYRQLHTPFEHGVTVLDLIFNEGADAWRYTKRF